MKKFFGVIGNPPYNEERQGDSKTAAPIYHKFMDGAFSVADKVELITPARFLFNAGATPKAWNKERLSDEHFKVLEYYEDARELFPNTEIKGGVTITYRDSDASFGSIGTFTSRPEINSILSKVLAISSEDSFGSMCFVASKFNTENLFKDYPEYEGHERRMSSNVLSFDCFNEQEFEGCTSVYGVQSGKRATRFIKSDYVDLSDENINKYKIVTPKADGNGTFGEKLANPTILNPNTGFTHTFLGIGGFDSYEEAEAALKYMKTKFARALLGVLKITQDLNAEKWKYVPLQDFTSLSDIEWSKSISDIDQQLYSKYGLTDEEIEFIETHVKEMD